MFNFFENYAERNFRKYIHRILVANVPNFEKMEGVLPHSTVETAYKTAWAQFGQPSHGKHPSIYRDECARGAEYIVEYYSTAMTLLAGLSSEQPAYRASEKYAEPLFELCKENAKDVMASPDFDPNLFALVLKSRREMVRTTLLGRLGPDEKRELASFALTIPSSGLTEADLARFKQEYGEKRAFEIGAERWIDTLFSFYCDQIIKGNQDQGFIP
jgi:hypothetical protein